ncbi:hypothetical protein R80B4_02126 [Fibrobacteres bacterium R8-0-B4]
MMKSFARQGRALLTILIVGALCLPGCGGGNKDASSSEKSGKFIDSRDGQTYKTVNIGNQMWMAENIRFKVAGSWCYSDCRKYGRWYNLNMAKAVCPKGWHLPSRDEWAELVTFVGSETAGKKLKSASGWNENGNGTDEFGFSALPGGDHSVANGRSFTVGYHGYWWTATEDSGGDDAYSRHMFYNLDSVGGQYCYKDHGCSVRCVAD